MRALRVLVVEDNAIIGMLLAEVLAGMGHDVCAIEATEADAVTAAARCRPDLMIVDVQLGDGSGAFAIEKRSECFVRMRFSISSMKLSNNSFSVFHSNSARSDSFSTENHHALVSKGRCGGSFAGKRDVAGECSCSGELATDAHTGRGRLERPDLLSVGRPQDR